MRLVNTTAAAAKLVVATTDDPAIRRGLVVARVDWRFDEAGSLRRHARAAPIRTSDVPHSLGLLPGDLDLVAAPHCEVIVLGHVHAPAGRTTQSQRVTVTLGGHARAIDVHGDRRWTRTATGWAIGPAEPYTRMPLVWSRAFGGSTRARLDPQGHLDVADEVNPEGRGFDGRDRAMATAAGLHCAPGYPVIEADDRLPNLEDPDAPIRARGDAPAPVCWSTVPAQMPIRFARVLTLARARGIAPPTPSGPQSPRARCHPDLLIPTPQAAMPVELRGLSPGGRITFALPSDDVAMDYQVGERRGTRTLRLARVLIDADEGRLELVYVARFTAPPPRAREERTIRLRIPPHASTNAPAGGPP